MTVIVSWNINSVRIRIDLLKELIKDLNPDVILLQEIKCANEDFPNFYSSLDYNAVINGQKGKYGVAILIKESLSYRTLDINNEIIKRESRTNFIYIEDLDLQILNVYTPNGNPMDDKEKFEFKISWLDEINNIAKNSINNIENIIIAGDFNELENEKDAKNFQNWEDDALGNIKVRQKFREILSSGLTNVVRLFNAPGEKSSFWDYQKACWERNDGLLIDHFLVSPKFTSLIKSINFESRYRGLTRPSDHIPVWISLDI